MAAGPTKELETLLIRLAGDGSQYASMMKTAVAQSTRASAQIAKQQKNIQAAAKQTAKAVSDSYKAAIPKYTGQSFKVFQEQYRLEKEIAKLRNDASKQAGYSAKANRFIGNADAMSSIIKQQSAMKQAVGQTRSQFLALKNSNADAMSSIIKQQSAAIVSTKQLAVKQVEGAKQASNAISSTTSQITTQRAAIENTSKTLYQHGKAIDHTANRMMDMGRGLSFYVTAPIVGVGMAMTKLAADYERNSLVFETILGKNAGTSLLKNMQHLADITPYTFEDVRGAGQTLMGYGMQTEKILDTVRMLGDVASGTGSDLLSLANVYGQIMNMGHLKGQDRLQLTSNRFPIKEISKTMGIDHSQFPKMMEEGKITFEIIERTFKRLTSEGGMFDNLMQNLSKTTVGVFSTFLDMIQKTGREMGRVLLPPANELMGILSNMFISLQQITPEFTTLSVKVLAVIAAIGPVLFTIGLILKPIAFFVSAVGGLGLVLSAVFTAPFWAIVSAVLLAVEGIYLAWVGINNATGGKLSEWLKDAAQWAGILKDDITLVKEAAEAAAAAPKMDWATVPEAVEFANAIKSVVSPEYIQAKQAEEVAKVTEAFEEMFDTVDTKGVAALKKYQEGMALATQAVDALVISKEKWLEIEKQLREEYEDAVPNEYNDALEAYEKLQKYMDISPEEQKFNENKNILYEAWQKGIIGGEEYFNRVNMLWADATGMIPAAWMPQQQQQQKMGLNEFSRMMGYGMFQPYFDPSMMEPSAPQRVKRDEAGEVSAGGLYGLVQSAGATQKTVEEEMVDEQKRTNEMLRMLYEKTGSSW